MLDVWQALDVRRRVIVGLSVAAMFAAVMLLGRAATTPGQALLYAGLDGAAAGEIIAALEQRAVPYEARGDAIFVASDQRDSLRMSLAAEGLPASGAAGYELLDGLTGFGTTAQMFDAAYWRAKEGELARTILANRNFRTARVHIAPVDGSSFRRDRRPTASVTLETGGTAISGAQARGLRYLIASAVAGMAPEDVAVIDSKGGLVTAGSAEESGLSPEDRAQALRRNVERLMEARVGFGRAIVEVSVDTTTEREQITERRFDPEGRVAISTETAENTTAATNTAAGAVTVASNLPDGDAGSGGTGNSSDTSQSTERTNYEVSETQRDLLRSPGAIKRITVAVLVDGVRSVDEAGNETWSALPDEELTALRDLVASAVGFDETRGDQITLKSLPIAPPAPAGDIVAPGVFSRLGLSAMALIQLGVLALVTLVIGLFVLRPILTARALPPAARLRGLPPPPADGAEAAAALPVLANLPAPARPRESAAAAELPASDPVARLRRLIEDRQEETVEILRGWMEDSQEAVR